MPIALADLKEDSSTGRSTPTLQARPMDEAPHDREIWGLCYSAHGIVLRRIHWCTPDCPRTFHGISHRVAMAPSWTLEDGGYAAPVGWIEFALTGEP